VQKRGTQRRHIEPQFGKNMCYFQGVREVGLPGLAYLRLMLLRSESKSALQRSEVLAGAILAHLFGQFGKARLESSFG
jgi:hypothetical protein